MKPISAIIPTCRRPLLVQRAVRSVLAQSYPEVEIVVVIDGRDDDTKAVLHAIDPQIRVLETGAPVGPAEARNVGVRAATGTLVALLDDDDEWTAEKLTVQMKLIDERGLSGEFIVSCRTECRSPDGAIVICPPSLYQPGGDFGEYIFDRKTPTARPGLVTSGTLLMPRALALRVPFPTDAAHEDLSWLLLCVTRDKVPLVMAEEAMFVYHLADPASRNHTQNWEESLAWARKYRRYMTGVAFSGLLASTTAWRAKRQAGVTGLVKIAKAMLIEGNSRLVHWMMLGGVAAVPLGALDKWRRWRR